MYISQCSYSNMFTFYPSVKRDRWCVTVWDSTKIHFLSLPLFSLVVSPTDTVAQLIPDADSPLHERVQQYRQLLDGLPMDAYTHGCILHPELTTDSMIPKYATAEIRSKWSRLTLPCRNDPLMCCRKQWMHTVYILYTFEIRLDCNVKSNCATIHVNSKKT